jgi:hypothetical protein
VNNVVTRSGERYYIRKAKKPRIRMRKRDNRNKEKENKKSQLIVRVVAYNLLMQQTTV